MGQIILTVLASIPTYYSKNCREYSSFGTDCVFFVRSGVCRIDCHGTNEFVEIRVRFKRYAHHFDILEAPTPAHLVSFRPHQAKNTIP